MHGTNPCRACSQARDLSYTVSYFLRMHHKQITSQMQLGGQQFRAPSPFRAGQRAREAPQQQWQSMLLDCFSDMDTCVSASCCLPAALCACQQCSLSLSQLPPVSKLAGRTVSGGQKGGQNGPLLHPAPVSIAQFSQGFNPYKGYLQASTVKYGSSAHLHAVSGLLVRPLPLWFRGSQDGGRRALVSCASCRSSLEWLGCWSARSACQAGSSQPM